MTQIEFIQQSGKIPAHFIVAEQIKEVFTSYLKSKNVCANNIQPHLSDSAGDNFSIEIQNGISPEDANSLLLGFREQQKK
jgi:hypothetical protein